MTRYRKKPVEVEAWQVGSDEPMPEWAASSRMLARVGNWLVLECADPKIVIECRSMNFEQTYEVVE